MKLSSQPKISHAPDRSRHLPEVRRSQAAGRGLGQRAAFHRRAAHASRTAASCPWARASSASRPSAWITCCAIGATSPWPSSRPRPPGQTAGRWPAAGQGVRRDARPEVRLRDQRPRDHRVRLLHRAGERLIAAYPTPAELWQRYRAGSRLSDDQRSPTVCSPHATTRSARASATTSRSPSTAPWKASSSGRRRLLLTMATGTGKTAVAFQICWKLWNARWNRTGEHRRPQHPLPRRPQHPGGPAQGRHLRRPSAMPATRSKPARSVQEPRDVLRHLPGPRRGRAPRRACSASSPPTSST